MAHSLPKVYLVRHGETAWTISGQHTGSTDIPLTPRGEQDAKALGERLRDLSFAVVLSSPRLRAKRTGELAGFGSAIQFENDLVEWDYGDYEGLTTPQIKEKRPDWSLFRDGCPNGENAADVGARADRVIAKLRASGQDALLFAHGHIFRVFAARWLNLPPERAGSLLLAPTSVSILSYEKTLDEPALQLWNDVCK